MRSIRPHQSEKPEAEEEGRLAFRAAGVAVFFLALSAIVAALGAAAVFVAAYFFAFLAFLAFLAGFLPFFAVFLVAFFAAIVSTSFRWRDPTCSVLITGLAGLVRRGYPPD